ncbi:hypothetical protein PGB90_007416 [Kerria lacca]
MDEKFSWEKIDFHYESEEARRHAIETNEYIPENNIPFGIELWREKLILTIPRRRPGVPSTLNYVYLNSSSNNKAPLLNPYPTWSSNKISSVFLISTYRVKADICDRLWTIDTGSVVDFDGKGIRIQSPRIKIFNLIENVLLLEYVLKQDDYVCDSSFTNIVIDVEANSCDEAFAYAVDPASNTVSVYSMKENDSWRVKHPYFLPDPLQTDFVIGKLKFQWDDGLFGFALADKNKEGFKDVYFHPMSSLFEFSLNTQILQNKSLTRSKTLSLDFNSIFKIMGSRSATFQAASSVYDPYSGILFFSLINKNGIGCWNSKKFSVYSADTNDIAVADNLTMIYISDIKLDKNGNLWAISNKLPILLYDTYDLQQINFRIFFSNIRKTIKNTNCEYNRLFWSKRT